MNTLIKSFSRNLMFSVERNNQFVPLSRFLNTTNVVESKRNDVSRKLGIPERPKKPLIGYLRFLNEIRPSIGKIAKNSKEVLTLGSVEWKKLDDNQKQKYNDQFKRDKVVYLKELQAFEKNITKEQKLAIKDELIRLKESKENREKKLELKTRLDKLGKPKRPYNAFFLYKIDEYAKGNKSVAEAKAKYDALSEPQKNVYKQKAEASLVEYQKALLAWKKQMVSKGMGDLIGIKKSPSKN